MFIIRDMQTGLLVGSPFTGTRIKWYGSNDVCDMTSPHGAEWKNGGDVVVQKVYEIIELTAGSGPSRSVGAPVYDSGQNRVTRTTTLSDPALSGAAKTAAVNAEADRRLLLAYPMSEQIWGALRASQIIAKKAIQGQNLTQGETNTLTAIGTAMTFVDAVRTARLALIAGGNLTMAQITDNANWPA